MVEPVAMPAVMWTWPVVEALAPVNPVACVSGRTSIRMERDAFGDLLSLRAMAPSKPWGKNSSLLSSTLPRSWSGLGGVSESYTSNSRVWPTTKALMTPRWFQVGSRVLLITFVLNFCVLFPGTWQMTYGSDLPAKNPSALYRPLAQKTVTLSLAILAPANFSMFCDETERRLTSTLSTWPAGTPPAGATCPEEPWAACCAWWVASSTAARSASSWVACTSTLTSTSMDPWSLLTPPLS
mmetsp:Transcript_83581/g.259663  ORF Transcript_83581/g.259663 Transcript_83581/m.259663 type:complete len:239 (-) Transcript_83581:927-1643(-)